MIWVLVALAAWAGGWWINARLAASSLSRRRAGRIAVPVIFGVTVLILGVSYRTELAGVGQRVRMTLSPAYPVATGPREPRRGAPHTFVNPSIRSAL